MFKMICWLKKVHCYGRATFDTFWSRFRLFPWGYMTESHTKSLTQSWRLISFFCADSSKVTTGIKQFHIKKSNTKTFSLKNIQKYFIHMFNNEKYINNILNIHPSSILSRLCACICVWGGDRASNLISLKTISLVSFSLPKKKEINNGGVRNSNMPWATGSDNIVYKTLWPWVYLTRNHSGFVRILHSGTRFWKVVFLPPETPNFCVHKRPNHSEKKSVLLKIIV